MKQLQRSAALLLAVCLCFAGCGKTEDGRATTMRLQKTEGAVSVRDEKEETVALLEKLPLYSGYSVETEADSYGWIDLDETKLAKLDAESAVCVQKEGRHLQLVIDQGSLFFNVAKPLGEDETMEIRTSGMIVGIRGTCGWVEVSGTVYILEGTVTCEFPALGLSAQVSAGEMAYLVRSAEARIEVRPFSRAEVPDYVRAELADAALDAIPEEPAGEPAQAPAPETDEPDGNVHTLPLSAEELRSLPGGSPDQPTIIRAGANDDTLVIDGFVSIYGYMVLEDGVALVLTEHSQLNIDGTLEVHSDVRNDGFIWILKDGTLQVDGAFSNTGMLVNGEVDKGMEEEGPIEVQNSRIIAAQGIESTGYLENAGTIEGTITANGGTVSLMAGTVDSLILNDGLYIDDGGGCGEFVQNGGKITSAAQGYYY